MANLRQADKLLLRLLLLAVMIALMVIVLGAYVRISGAGLGCPDWPGCYGQILAPDNYQEIARANMEYPDRPVDPAKAWKEMAHRYLASTLGLIIVMIAIVAWRGRRDGRQQVYLPAGLVLLVIFQGMLGMWTVTLLLKPAVVTLHLLAGMLTLALLWLAYLRQSAVTNFFGHGKGWWRESIRPWARFGLLVLFCQIALGGWTSTNYAALQCPDFPTCQGQWWPPMDYVNAFRLWESGSANYEGGSLSNIQAVTVHVTHRLGALLTFLVLGLLGIKIFVKTTDPSIRNIAGWMLIMLMVQVALGIGSVMLHLPAGLAVAHNAGAAVLLLIMVTLNYQLTTRS